MGSDHEVFISDPSAVLKKIEKSGWMILGLLSAGTLFLVSASFAAGIALGGILGLGNFRCVEIYFAWIFRQGGSGSKWWHHAFYGLRFLVLLAAVAGAIAWGRLPIVSVVLGLSAPFMGILFFAVLALTKGEAAAKA